MNKKGCKQLLQEKRDFWKKQVSACQKCELSQVKGVEKYPVSKVSRKSLCRYA